MTAPSAAAFKRLELIGATCPVSEGVRRKFPRSSHLANLGAATHDDLLLDATARALFVGETSGMVTLEEKMDGGNIGISLSEGERHVFQKRAHYVSSASETQYAQLETWAEQHAAELWDLLRAPYPWQPQGTRTEAVPPGQRIVFGEWCAYQHTVGYDSLPDTFLAFDIYDETLNAGAGGFLSTKLRNQLLSATSIRHVRCVARGKFKRVADVIGALEGAMSPYASTPTQIEGVYMRVDDEATGTLIARGKLVHPEFLQHIEEDGRWERNAQKNSVRLDWWYDRDNEGNLKEREPEPQEPMVKRCKALYAQLSQAEARSVTKAALAEMGEAAEAALVASDGQQPFALLCKGWFALQHNQLAGAEAALQQGLQLLRAKGKAGTTTAEMERLLALCRGAADPDDGMGLVRTLSQRERAQAAAADAEAKEDRVAEKALAAELRSVNDQVAMVVTGGAGDGGGWLDPVPTPALLTSQIWSTFPAKRMKSEHRTSVLGFYGHALGRPNACFSNFAAAPVAEPFNFVLPSGLIPQGVDPTVFSSPIVVEFSEKAIMLCKAAAMGDSEGYLDIAMTTNPRSTKAKGRQVYPFDNDRWQALVCHVAREVCWQKFSQVPRMRELLLSTCDRIIAEATRNDKIWGIGLDMTERDVGTPAK